jgi:hypothetical protein
VFQHPDPGCKSPDGPDKDGRRTGDVSVGTLSEWRYRALRCIEDLADKGEPFTSDDVHYEIGDPPEPNQMGAAFRDAHGMQLIQPIGTKKSNRKESKGRLIQVWVKADRAQGGLF